MKKVTVNVVGTVTGYVEDNMSDEEAKAKVMFDAELSINESHGSSIRAHLSIGSSPDQYQTTALRTDNTDYEGIKRRINLPVLTELYVHFNDMVQSCLALDKLKKWIFYGKPIEGQLDRPKVAHFATPQQMSQALFEVINDQNIDHLHGILGICTESSELASNLCVKMFDGVKISETDWIKEYGDVAWYLAKGCKAVPAKLSTALDMNVEKLQKRYPDKFSESAAQNHDGK